MRQGIACIFVTPYILDRRLHTLARPIFPYLGKICLPIYRFLLISAPFFKIETKHNEKSNYEHPYSHYVKIYLDNWKRRYVMDCMNVIILLRINEEKKYIII